MSIDSDSSETDTEELVRQEKEKRIEAEARRRAVEEAKRNAVYLMNLVAAKKQAEREQVEAEKTETQNKREDGDDVEGEVNGGGPFDELSVGSNVEVFARSNNSEQLYSPGSSAALEQSPSSARKSTRLLPSRLVVTFCSPNHTTVTQYCHFLHMYIHRLSFGAVEGEHSSDAEHSNPPKSQPKTRKSKSGSNLQSTFLAASHVLDTVSLNTENVLIQKTGHISASTEASFQPAKTSTQLKKKGQQPQQKGGASKRKSKRASKRLPSSIHPLYQMELSDSESERDETLEMLLAEDADLFQGLSQLTKSRMAATSSKRNEESAASAKTTAKKSRKRNFARKSTGNSPVVTQKMPRKSVTFVAGSGSETEGDGLERPNTTKPPPSAIDDVYMSFDDDLEVSKLSPLTVTCTFWCAISNLKYGHVIGFKISDWLEVMW